MQRLSAALGALILCALLACPGVATSNQSSTADRRLPAPQGVRAKAGLKKVLLTWKPVSGSSGYRIYWAKEGRAIPRAAQLDEVPSDRLYYRVGYLLPAVSYHFRVCALRSCEEGRLSRKVSASPRGKGRARLSGRVALEKAGEDDWMGSPEKGASLTAGKLPPPKGLTASSMAGGVLLKWKPVSGSAGYRIYWEEGGRVSRCSNRIDDLPPDQVSYRMEHLSAGVAYRFRVSTLSGTEEGPLSREVGAKPKEGTKLKGSDGAP